MADPALGLRRRGREQLAVLCRELLLAGHLIDRAGMPHVIALLGRDGMRDVAIDEWMGASPTYTRRTQRALGFDGGTDVATIFKGMQVDIGAPPQFMDFRYRVHDGHHGEFQVAHCGALMDVEPMGDDYVVAMCHHIEDPTFDATAMATNPRAQVRPVHRPPRSPADRHPHCHWTVEVVPQAEPLVEPAITRRIAATRAAATVLEAVPDDPADPGRRAYDGPLEPELDLASFSRATLVTIAEEVCLQGQLLALAFLDALAERAGERAAREVGAQQLTGVAGVVAGRLAAALGGGRSPADVAAVLAVHPALQPRPYVEVELDVGDDGLELRLLRCAALEEPAPGGWPALLADGLADGAVAAILAGVGAPLRARPVTRPGAARAWEVVPAAEPAPEPPEVALTRFSTGASFRFR